MAMSRQRTKAPGFTGPLGVLVPSCLCAYSRSGIPISSTMYQVMLDRLAVFDHLIPDAAGWPESRADGNRCANRGDLFHLRVVMRLVMVPFINPRVMHTVMTMR